MLNFLPWDQSSSIEGSTSQLELTCDDSQCDYTVYLVKYWKQIQLKQYLESNTLKSTWKDVSLLIIQMYKSFYPTEDWNETEVWRMEMNK